MMRFGSYLNGVRKAQIERAKLQFFLHIRNNLSAKTPKISTNDGKRPPQSPSKEGVQSGNRGKTVIIVRVVGTYNYAVVIAHGWFVVRFGVLKYSL